MGTARISRSEWEALGRKTDQYAIDNTDSRGFSPDSGVKKLDAYGDFVEVEFPEGLSLQEFRTYYIEAFDPGAAKNIAKNNLRYQSADIAGNVIGKTGLSPIETAIDIADMQMSLSGSATGAINVARNGNVIEIKDGLNNKARIVIERGPNGPADVKISYTIALKDPQASGSYVKETNHNFMNGVRQIIQPFRGSDTSSLKNGSGTVTVSDAQHWDKISDKAVELRLKRFDTEVTVRGVFDELGVSRDIGSAAREVTQAIRVVPGADVSAHAYFQDVAHLMNAEQQLQFIDLLSESKARPDDPAVFARMADFKDEILSGIEQRRILAHGKTLHEAGKIPRSALDEISVTQGGDASRASHQAMLRDDADRRAFLRLMQEEADAEEFLALSNKDFKPRGSANTGPGIEPDAGLGPPNGGEGGGTGSRIVGKLGVIGGFIAGTYFAFQGDYATAAEVAVPGGASTVALSEGRWEEAILAGVEETGVGLLVTEPVRPLLILLGRPVEPGAIASMWNYASEPPPFPELVNNLMNYTVADVYELRAELPANIREIRERVRNISQITDPAARAQAVSDFMWEARVDATGRLTAFVDKHAEMLAEHLPGMTREEMIGALMDPVQFEKAFGNAHAEVRTMMDREFSPIRHSFYVLDNTHAYLVQTAAQKAIEIRVGPEQQPSSQPRVSPDPLPKDSPALVSGTGGFSPSGMG